MNRTLQLCQRWCTVERRQKLDPRAVRTEILRHQNVNGEFNLTATPAPARDQTLFKVYTDGNELLVAVAVFESVGPTTRHSSAQVPNRNTIEIFFAPWNDELGWYQFYFDPAGPVTEFSHLPYPETHSTAFKRLPLKRHRWETDGESVSHRLYWLFAWFPAAEVFCRGSVCGFNVTRFSPPIEESSAWNHVAGVSFQDATTFGRLALRKPAKADLRQIRIPPAPAQARRDFRLSITYDIPDNVAYTNYYTPQRLERELAAWKSFGINRVYWIEYGRISQWPSFWKLMIGPRHRFADCVALTRRHCDDTLAWAARSAKRLGLEIIAVYKPFDLGFNTEWTQNDGVSCAKEIENRFVCAHPDVAAHPEWTMQSHPGWRKRARFPITRLALYSEQPLGRFTARDLALWVSHDNKRFERYRGPWRLAAGPVRRPHYRWTPAGKVAASSVVRNWRVELTGLNLRAPFLAIGIQGKSFAMTHRMFAFAEAQNADGSEAPVTLATHGDRANGFRFCKTWLGWANHNEPLIDPYTWTGPELGITFQEPAHASTLLEPSFAGARGIWLKHVERILKTGVDGVEIRTIGHHNIVPSYLSLAFAEPVRAEFRTRFGRDVEPTPVDYERIRRVRGDAYTTFMRDARTLANRYGRKLTAHIEAGAEVPPHLDLRLQMQMAVEWQRWIRERIVDEVSLRGWGCYNRYVHRELLPLARRHGVGVHIISKNLPGGIDLRAMELVERWLTEACAAGFAGYSLYEADSLLRMNAEGVPMSVGNTAQAVRKAADSLWNR